MNQVTREVLVNSVQTLIAQADVTDVGVTGSTVDLVDTKRPKHIILVVTGAPVEVDRAFVRIEESDEGTVWFPVTQFDPLIAAGARMYSITRTKRRIRAVVAVETPALPTAPIIPLAVFLLS